MISIAWNIRRIFVVLLTGLVLWAIYEATALYISIAEDHSNIVSAVRISLVLSALVAAVGIYYAIFSKRLSRPS